LLSDRLLNPVSFLCKWVTGSRS